MRERLVGSFVLLTVFIIVMFGVVRAYALTDLFREAEASKLDRSVVLMAALVGERANNGKVTNARQIGEYLDRAQRIEYVNAEGKRVVAKSRTYITGQSGNDLVSSATVVGGGSLTLEQSGFIVDKRVADAILPILQLALLLVAVAAAVGYVLAWRLARPFQKLALIADDLGRGELDTEISHFSIREADAISRAMHTSAIRLKALARKEREFASNASHQLRTPITALHLELEDLAVWDETPPIVADELRRSVLELDRLSEAVTSLLDMARGNEVTAGPAIDVSALAIDAAQRWRPQVAAVERKIWAVTPGVVLMNTAKGRVNQILDVLIENSIKHGVGRIELVVTELDAHTRLSLNDQGASKMDNSVFARRVRGSDSGGEGIGLSIAAELARSLGGFLAVGDGPTTSFDLMLPRS
ncbi:MAG: HAMP domain-containing histidine kinase [Kineosporiaceae bacterium]|nr:HAMP domain-containing histidine kinase [Aeromicrobium sp.]